MSGITGNYSHLNGGYVPGEYYGECDYYDSESILGLQYWSCKNSKVEYEDKNQTGRPGGIYSRPRSSPDSSWIWIVSTSEKSQLKG